MVEARTIEESIIFNIKDENVVFVFPTEVSCKAWMDWAIANKDKTGVSAVAMERFIAWDKFKGECIRTKQAEKSTVPSLMRKIFASYLIEKNAEIKRKNITNKENKPLLFKTLITSEYADNASAFSDWIAKILPSLRIWKTYHDTEEYKNVIERMKKEAEKEGKQFSLNANDDEDNDYETLYKEYEAFLLENDLFDPAWEQPPFTSNDENTKYVIVYPQVYEDWTQYEYLLKMAEKDKSLSFVNVPQNIVPENHQWCHFDNSVEELHNVALYLRDLHDNKNVAWTDIALSVPNMDTYGSYLERELNLFEIPNVMRFSQMLSDHGAGKLFSQIQECVRTDFSFDSIKTLLLNDDIPWKNHYLIDNLILFGKKNNCVCSFVAADGTKIDIWEKSFDNPVRNPRDENIPERKEKNEKMIKELKDFYMALKNTTRNMVHAKTFSGLLKAYRRFRRNFIDRHGFVNMKTSDLILSRCIAELAGLVELESKYCKENEKDSGKRTDGKTAYKIHNVFGFFISHLDQTQYLDQTEQRGIQVYPYRAAAASPYKYHVVLDATQDSLAVGSLFKQLNFLNETKRNVILKINPETNDKFFKFTEFDPSECFISLYQLSSKNRSYFTSSNHSVGGYGFPHGALKAEFEIKESDAKNCFGENIFAVEKLKLATSSNALPDSILKVQKVGFKNWSKQKIQLETNKKNPNVPELEFQTLEIQSLIDKKFFDKKEKRFKISASSLKTFYKCPRQWLFEKVLGLRPMNNEADLMNEFIVGKINHAIFEEYLTALKNYKIPGLAGAELLLGATMNIQQNGTKTVLTDLKDEFKDILKNSISKANDRFLHPEKYADEDSFDDTLSEMTRTIILSQKNELYTKLLPSVEAFSRYFSEMSVYKLEEHYQFFPQDEDGNAKNYYFDGRVDCILKKQTADSSEFFIIDFKSGSIPSPILFDSEKPNDIPDFQMPVYKKLFAGNEKFSNGDFIEPSDYYFYSLKDNTINGGVTLKGLDKDKFAITCNVCDEKIENFVERIQNLDFSINEDIQNKGVCANKGFGASCKDYQAICRRFFSVAGE